MSGEQVAVHQVLGDARGRFALIVDDMISTAGTVRAAAEALRAAGAEGIAVAATHGLFVGPAEQRLQAAHLERLFVTDSIALRGLPFAVEVVPVAPLFTEALRRP